MYVLYQWDLVRLICISKVSVFFTHPVLSIDVVSDRSLFMAGGGGRRENGGVTKKLGMTGVG